MYTITSDNCVHFANRSITKKPKTEVLAKSYLGFCKKNKTDDTYDIDENNACFLM